jgi:phosphoenolpyruvate---glycerone phosphotransferase subunit DhaL
MANESYPATGGRPLVLALVETIETNRGYLSEVDGAIGDGDHGINMSKGFVLAKTRLADQEISVSDGLALIGKTLMTEIGGAMGPIYGTFFIQMSLQSKNKPVIDAETFGGMLTAARKAVEDLGGAKPGDKTIMDTLVPAQETYQGAISAGASFHQALQQMADAAEQGKESTRNLVAKIGRASRLGERSRGTLDPGATSCALILRTFANVLSGAP